MQSQSQNSGQTARVRLLASTRPEDRAAPHQLPTAPIGAPSDAHRKGEETSDDWMAENVLWILPIGLFVFLIVCGAVMLV